ncbi:MAG: PAS domain S-box protein, partial [Syntrophobacterales bacterium]|nr:PAS domain S-box protein [Syntrophobacterales bacterium]
GEDITERKEAEEALRESEERHRSLINDVLDTSKVGIFILDAEFKIVWVNRALERYFGLRREDVIGQDKRQLIRKRIKDIFEDPESFIKKVIATYDNNTYVENFECHVLPDGDHEERWLKHWSQPIQSGLYVGGRVEHYTDITGRKQAEEKIKHLNLVLRAIRNVNQLVVTEKNRDRLLQGACDNLTETRGYYSAWIVLLDEAGKYVMSAESGLGKDFLPMIEMLKKGEITLCGEKALLQTGVVVTENPLSTCVDCPLSEKHAGRNAMTIRLEHGEKVYGFLSVSIPEDFVLDEEEQGLFKEVGGISPLPCVE